MRSSERWQKSKSTLLSASEKSRYKAEITAALQQAALPWDGLRGATLGHTPKGSHSHTTVLHTTTHHADSLQSLLWPSYCCSAQLARRRPRARCSHSVRSYQRQTTAAGTHQTSPKAAVRQPSPAKPWLVCSSTFSST